jgi:hypothetical protein
MVCVTMTDSDRPNADTDAQFGSDWREYVSCILGICMCLFLFQMLTINSAVVSGVGNNQLYLDLLSQLWLTCALCRVCI